MFKVGSPTEFKLSTGAKLVIFPGPPEFEKKMDWIKSVEEDLKPYGLEVSTAVASYAYDYKWGFKTLKSLLTHAKANGVDHTHLWVTLRKDLLRWNAAESTLVGRYANQKELQDFKHLVECVKKRPPYPSHLFDFDGDGE